MSDRQASANYPHPILAREGWLFIFFAIAATAAVHFFFGFLPAAPFWLLSVFIIQFFRDPPRTVAGDSGCVVAPADGRVTAIEHANDPYLNREAIKVSVFMNVFNVHSQRSPVDGLVKARWYYKGKFFNAALDKASTENERNALHIVTDNGYDIVCVQVAGLVARRILCFVEPDTHLVRGERYGFIRFGSRLDLYLPMTARVKVGLGQKVSAASTIIAELS